MNQKTLEKLIKTTNQYAGIDIDSYHDHGDHVSILILQKEMPSRTLLALRELDWYPKAISTVNNKVFAMFARDAITIHPTV